MRAVRVAAHGGGYGGCREAGDVACRALGLELVSTGEPMDARGCVRIYVMRDGSCMRARDGFPGEALSVGTAVSGATYRHDDMAQRHVEMM